ncbi:MAG: hypothetical protein K2N34_01515, partial [Lachnospiraceae bacterium]|nr:hypothetical protein [Lachnospiraceae bacterium]
MACVGFENNGYKYFETGGQLLFSSDSSHNYLFEYVTKDLSMLPELFDQYISSKININTFTFKKQKKNADYIIDEIRNVLASIHPYYEHECDKIILNEIGKYY